MSSKNEITTTETSEVEVVKHRIYEVRSLREIHDRDLAELYGVETRRVNEAVRNNPDKFPLDYMFELTTNELRTLRSKISTTKVSVKSRSATKVFTKKVYMLATILKSERATTATFAIIETFAKVRGLKRELVELHKETDKGVQEKKMHYFGEVLTDIVMPDLKTSETESSLEINFNNR